MMTKYNFDLNNSSIYQDISRLTNQIWKLIPMRENKEDWEKQIDSVLVECLGLCEIFKQTSTFLQITSKLEGLIAKEDVEFSIYRKTIFEIISLLQDFKNVL